MPPESSRMTGSDTSETNPKEKRGSYSFDVICVSSAFLGCCVVLFVVRFSDCTGLFYCYPSFRLLNVSCVFFFPLLCIVLLKTKKGQVLRKKAPDMLYDCLGEAHVPGHVPLQMRSLFSVMAPWVESKKLSPPVSLNFMAKPAQK